MKLQTILERAKQHTPSPQTTNEGEAERNSFVKRFPKESINNLTVEEYANTKTKDSFIYWLERKNILAGIGGGNSAKFGIYRAQSGDYCQSYGKNKVILEDEKLQKEFNDLINLIVQAITLAEEDRIAEISKLENPLFNMVLLKILNIYVPEKFLNLYSPPILLELGKELGVKDELLVPQFSIELNYEIKRLLKEQDVFAQWSTHQIGSFIWNLFAEMDAKIDDTIDYYLVGHTYENEGSVQDFLLNENSIAVGFLREDLTVYLLSENMEDIIEEKEETSAGQKALKQFFSMKEGDLVALKSTFTRKIDGKTKSILRISAVGKITADALEGYRFSKDYGHYIPVKWFDKEVKEYVGYGGYRSTINKVKDKRVINLVFMNEVNEQKVPATQELEKIPNNYVLYGPPGTGKTYHVVDRALEIIDNKTFNELNADGRDALQKEYARLTSEGNISLITFHQSYAYEDFIEGLKSDGNGNFIPSDGIFKRAAIEAMYDGLEQQNTREFSDEVRFEQIYDQLVTSGEKQNIQFESKTGGVLHIEQISTNNNVVITSEDAKTSSIISKDRLLRIYRYIKSNEIDWKSNVSFISDAIGGSNATRYWAVLNWILTKMVDEEIEDSVEIEGDEKKKIVLKALKERRAFDFTNARRHVLVIDEMNRGNISKIFGELLTLLEEDKRLTSENELIVELPYSKDPFTLPPNLFVIGTMNTADRSIALLDTALRRRFVFEEMMPEPETLESIGQEIDVEAMLTIMNQRIEVLYDRDHMIGHAYFINATSDEEIITIMQSKVIPLLQEYFYDEWEKIGLVLGGVGATRDDPFIVYEEKVDINQLFKQKPSIYVPTIYRVKKKLTAQELIAIYE
ncbi:AAA family ATPase [Virgibacillus profundi]|uniref:AAA family ATPase n=1 Tax=Virgibacillus profundi TaxID=2024555 RepID=A0A2A2I900_9BACI|nr:AAA family ATPase [Virgibacillus profundi]PAV27796.1 AAA family ATPase [Virgibacillus profundi]PXY52018.1 AAA family ATPase [Virgibacillus profundi]